MPYLLFLKKRQNWKLSSVANYRVKSLPATGPHIADGNVSTTDARLTADPGVQEFDPGQVPYFRGD